MLPALELHGAGMRSDAGSWMLDAGQIKKIQHPRLHRLSKENDEQARPASSICSNLVSCLIQKLDINFKTVAYVAAIKGNGACQTRLWSLGPAFLLKQGFSRTAAVLANSFGGIGMRPLDGIKIIEMAGLAPAPYCGMILADFGADVVVVDRLSKGSPETPLFMSKDPLDRGKRSIRIDLKTEEGIAMVKRQIVSSDVLLEPYRPGVMEKLGIGPDDALKLNAKLI